MFLRRLLSLVLISSMIGCAGNPEELESAYFEEAYEQINDPSRADGHSCNGVSVPDQRGFNKRVALTFDDGPNPATTPRVVEILRRRQIPAAFLMNGSRFATRGASEVLEDIVSDPLFVVGNHSQSHLNLATVSVDKLRSEVGSTAAVLDRAGVKRTWFRFPFGSATCKGLDVVRSEFGYTPLGWHIDSADWCFQAGGGYCKPSTFRYVDSDLRDDMTGWVMKQVRAKNGGILLFHDVHANTAAHLEAILDALIAEGYTFVRVDDANAFPQLNAQAPQSSSAFIGTACDGDEDCDFTANGVASFCHEPGGFCTIPCEGRCPDRAGYAGTFCVADPSSAAARGICVSVPDAHNDQCGDLPMTSIESADRYIGSSTAIAANKEVCLPAAESTQEIR